jgi:hypothetical protein
MHRHQAGPAARPDRRLKPPSWGFLGAYSSASREVNERGRLAYGCKGEMPFRSPHGSVRRRRGAARIGDSKGSMFVRMTSVFL